MGYFDWDIHAYRDGDHDISSKDEKNVVEEETAEKNEACPKCIQLNILPSQILSSGEDTSRQLKATASPKILDMIQFLVNA